MVRSRLCLLRTLQQRLKVINTYPGIISAICKIINEGFCNNWWTSLPAEDEFSCAIKDAIENQSGPGHHSVPKGYLIHEWKQIQIMWETLAKQLHPSTTGVKK